jgi:hypothetical protein
MMASSLPTMPRPVPGRHVPRSSALCGSVILTGKSSEGQPQPWATSNNRHQNFPNFHRRDRRMFAADYSRVRDFLPIARVSGDHSTEAQKGCATRRLQSCIGRVGVNQRLHLGDFVLVAVAQRYLMDFIPNLDAD